MAGWIKIHREIQQHWIAQDMEKFGWWVDMLLLASYEDNKALLGTHLIEIKRGSFIGSARFLASRWNTTKDKVNAFLNLLSQEGMITRETSKNTTLVTICNYESYQENQEGAETPLRHSCDTLATPLRQTKEIKEDKEIYIQANNTCTREESVTTWDASKEQGFYQTFKGQGAAIPMATKTGRAAREILQLLDVYMAHRQLKNLGHTDYAGFVNLFAWHIENNKISIPTKQQTTTKKVVAGADILKIYG